MIPILEEIPRINLSQLELRAPAYLEIEWKRFCPCFVLAITDARTSCDQIIQEIFML